MFKSIASIKRALIKLKKHENRKPRLGRKICVRMAIALAIATAPALAATADQLPDHYGKIIIEIIRATPAEAGDRSKLRFRLVDESYDPVPLTSKFSESRDDLFLSLWFRYDIRVVLCPVMRAGGVAPPRSPRA